jgi:hypothetical protein
MTTEDKASIRIDIVYKENGINKYSPYYELIDWEKMD